MTRIGFLVFLATLVALQAQEAAPNKRTAKVVPGNKPALLTPGEDGKIHLLASNASLYGDKIAVYEPQRCIGWWTGESDEVAWEVETSKAGTYDVTLEWSISDEWAGNRFVLTSGGQKLEGTIPPTGGFEHFKEKSFGTLQLDAGKQTVSMRALGPVKGELADLRRVTLVPQATTGSQTAKACYELRIYYAAPGKLDALHTRFRDHTIQLFARHGITSLGYWVPQTNSENKLLFLLRYPSREQRDVSWKNFATDPEWKKAQGESEANGKLVNRVEQLFLEETDYSPPVVTGNFANGGIYNLRTYITPAGLLPNLDKRFREHTVQLFEKHGMHNWGYFHKQSGQPAADTTLIYFLAHPSEEAMKKSFDAFRKDPVWLAAKEKSEKEAGGSLTIKDGVKSELLVPTDYSPTK